MQKLRMQAPALCLASFLLFGCGDGLDSSSSSLQSEEGTASNIQDSIGSAADGILGVWKGNRLGSGSPCELEVSNYYTGFSGDTSPNPLKVRRLLFAVRATGPGDTSSLQHEGTRQFLEQGKGSKISLDYSQSNDGFGAILRQYSRINVSMAFGRPVAARAESGSIQLQVFVEKDVDIACVNLRK